MAENGPGVSKLMQLGVGGFIVVAVLYMVFDFLGKQGVVGATPQAAATVSLEGYAKTADLEKHDGKSAHDDQRVAGQRRDDKLEDHERRIRQVEENIESIETEQRALPRKVVDELQRRGGTP